jgi:hypothetical protein
MLPFMPLCVRQPRAALNLAAKQIAGKAAPNRSHSLSSKSAGGSGLVQIRTIMKLFCEKAP